MQHAAMLDVVDLDLGIDPALDLDGLFHPIDSADGAGHFGKRFEIARQAEDGNHLVAFQPQGLARRPTGKLERDHPHPDQVGAVDTLETFGDHRLDPQKRRTLGRPVTTGAGPVFDAAKNHQRRARRLIGHRGVIDRGLRAIRALGIAALDPASVRIGQHFIPDPDIGESAAHHDFMVAAPRTIGIELADRHLPLQQILAGRCGALE